LVLGSTARRWLGGLVNLSSGQLLLAGWLGLSSLAALLLFGYDKWQAGRGGGRVAESTLWFVSAFGGWPGGFVAMMIFRHKIAKTMFLLEFAAALFVWLTLLGAAWKLGMK
jgi:uncharacterized membrane protein YsdA (DUF1294 family)